MRAEFINPFLTATHDVFLTMLNCELTRGELGLKRHHTPDFEVSGLIGLTGKYQGMVVLGLGRDTALKAAEIMLGQPTDGLDSDVMDAVGEITNMIAGAAKSALEEFQLTIGLPTVISGKNHSISFPSNSKPIILPFESNIGSICLDVGLVEVPVEAGV